MSENPYHLAYGGIPDDAERRQYFAWQQGHDSREAEVAALKAELFEARRAINISSLREGLEVKRLKAELAELRSLSLALVRATRLSLQGEATVSVAEEAADEVEEWMEEPPWRETSNE